MNFRKFVVFIASFLSGFIAVYGSGLPKNRDRLPSVKQFINHSDWNFVENKGQLPSSDIKYYGHQGGVYLYCKPGMISFVFTKVEKEYDQISEATSQPSGSNSPFKRGPGGFGREKNQPSKITTFRADLVLINSNPSAQIIASDQQEYYENYYTENTNEEGITNIHTYKTITYKSIYPNIDLVLHTKANGMKYEFVVYPGGKVSDIQIQWNGMENIKKNKDSGIEYSVALGKMDESKPESFQGEYSIKSDFIKNENRIGFKIGKYHKTKTLVIDPTLQWGTYFGGISGESSTGVATDSSGNVYITGETESDFGIATMGIFQSTFGGNDYDAYLAKFNQNGALQWTTYYGGVGLDYGSSVATDINGNVFMSGGTTSPSGIATSGAYQTSFSNLFHHNAINNADFSEAFIAKFTGNGNRLWGTYLWNSYEEIGGQGASNISSDKGGNIFITGTTTTQSGLATAGAFQSVWTLGLPQNSASEGYLAKFSGTGSIQWATYIGGNSLIGNNGNAAFVACSGISIDDSNYIYLTGYTNCTSGIATKGAYQTTLSGISSALILKFNTSGSRLWATYFGGNGETGSNSITTYLSSDVYIAGWTSSPIGIATAGAYQTALSLQSSSNRGACHFLAKFDNVGLIRWGTYFGDTSSVTNIEAATDRYGNIYFTGSTFSNNNIATNGAYQSSFAGVEDVFLEKFNGAGDRLWGTYYGGTAADESYGIATDKSGHVYLTGVTNSPLKMATNGAYKTIIPGDSGSGFLAKFGTFQYDAGIASIISLNDTICEGSQPVIAQFKNFGIREIDSLHIGWSVNGKTQTSIKWSGKLLSDSFSTLKLGNYNFQPGIDTIKAWTSTPNGVIDSFPGNDSTIITIVVSAPPTAIAGPDTTLCYNETYTMRGAGGITYLWTPAKYLSNDTIAAPKAVLPNTQLYTLYVRNKYGCEDSSQVLLTVKPKLSVKIGSFSNPVCYSSPVSLSAVGSGGDSNHYSFDWSIDSLVGNPINPIIYKSGFHKVILSDNCSGLPAMDSVYINVVPRPTADFAILNRHPYVQDTSFRFQNLSKNATKYLWTFGDSSASNTASDPVHIYTDSGTYKISLVAYGKCANDTGYGYIHIFGKYINIYIPDAFSPNGDGVNDIFDIKGLGFVDYNFSIYNRWGELTFETTDTKKSWDGIFKNQPATEGIYVYMIMVTDQFGIKHYFSGSLTLMR